MQKPARKEVTITARAELIKIWVDGVRVSLTNGTGVVSVEPGKHAISWVVRGARGTTYALQITKPTEARLTRGDTFDEVGMDAGVAWFTVK